MTKSCFPISYAEAADRRRHYIIEYRVTRPRLYIIVFHGRVCDSKLCVFGFDFGHTE